MALENVRLEDGNICTDRQHLYAYTFSLDEQALLVKSKTTGSIIQSYIADTIFTNVYSLEFDGYYFWTLEQIVDGVLVRKWELDTSIVRLVDSFSFVSAPSFGIESEALAVENYYTLVDIPAGPGVGSVDVDDASSFSVGDEIVLGPSTAGGYLGNYDKVSILGISGNTISFTPFLSNRFNANDEVYTAPYFWIVSNKGDVDDNGSLIKVNAKTGVISAVDFNTTYKGVTASTFFNGKVLYLKGTSVFWINPVSFGISQVMAVDNLKSNRSDLITVYDMYGYDDILYRLQLETAYKSGSNWLSESWATYNTVSSNIIPEVYMINIRVDPPVLHCIASPFVTVASGTVTCFVFDQYYTPVFGKTINFTSSAGIVTPTQATTDANGFCMTYYFGDTTVGQILVTATTA